MRSYPVVLVILVLAAVSCGGDHGHDNGHEHDNGDGHEQVGEHATKLGLGLNAGRKWQMDEHTRSMFKAMTEKIDAHVGDDAKSLGAALQADLGELIAGCTMTGEAHDELHKFLVLYMPAVSSLEEAGGESEMKRVKDLIGAYPMFFE